MPRSREDYRFPIVSPSFDPPRGRVAGPGPRAKGSFPKGAGRLSEKSPPGNAPPHHRDAPPGSAGVPPACYPVACRSVSLRCGTRPPCRRERHGLGRSRVLAPLPVDPVRGDGRGGAKTCADGTPALPGGLHPMTSSQQRRSIGLRVYSWLVHNNDRQFLPRMIRPAGRGRTCL